MIFLTDENIYLTAYIKGDISSPNLNGIAYFKPFKDGVMVEVEVSGLPGYKSYELFPIHIHDGKNCELSSDGTFLNVGKHYNPTNTSILIMLEICLYYFLIVVMHT